MDKRISAFYVLVAFGLLFLIPVAESVDQNLGKVATFLVIGYWLMLGFSFLTTLVKNFFAEFAIRHLLYNLWLFVSLMCVAVGILAIIDDGADKARWAVLLILYGGTVGYINRKEL